MLRNALIALILVLTSPAAMRGQVGRVLVDENVRSEPNGVLLGQVAQGSLLGAIRVEGDWVEFALEGWVWARSLRVIDRGGFDLAVSVDGGENIRATPSGSALGILEDGTLLNEVERVPGWVRVRRPMWIWSESLEISGDGNDGVSEPDLGASLEKRFRAAGPLGLAVLAAPDGDTLVRVRSGGDVEVLAREGSWARVRLEGWAWLPLSGDGEDAEHSALVDVDPGQVSDNPDAFRGRIVEWDLQFVSLERAEKVRTDFYEGEPFLLTRTTEAAAALFVYVAVPPERLSEMEALTPLEHIRVIGRIRVGSASLTGSPIIDLLEMRSGRRP